MNTTIDTQIVEVEKLIASIINFSYYEIGENCTNKDGLPYRYDTYKSKYEHAPNWLVAMYNKASRKVSGKEYADLYFHYGNYTISYNRPKFKGGINGKIRMTQLITL